MKGRLWLHWDERLRDYVHKPSGASFESLARVARLHGYRWTLSYPEGQKARWAWFEVHKPPTSTPRRKRSR